MFMKNGEIVTEPYIPEHVTPDENGKVKIDLQDMNIYAWKEEMR